MLIRFHVHILFAEPIWKAMPIQSERAAASLRNTRLDECCEH
jgi:hypothetical protein